MYNAYTTYDDFLESNFDGTRNSISPLPQIYLSGKVDNEVCTFIEVLKQPDKDQFEVVVYNMAFKHHILRRAFHEECRRRILLINMIRFSFSYQ